MRHRSANGKEAPASVPAQPRGYGLIGALELMPREGKAALTPTSMLGNKADTLTRTQGVIVRGIRDLTASPTPKWTNSLMRYAKD